MRVALQQGRLSLGHAAWPVRKYPSPPSLLLPGHCGRGGKKVPRYDPITSRLGGHSTTFPCRYISLTVSGKTPRSDACSSSGSTVTGAEASSGGTAHRASRGQSQSSVRTWKQEAKACMGTRRGGWWIEGGDEEWGGEPLLLG